MNKICTSLEQSKKLMELGINVDTADMRYSYIAPYNPSFCDDMVYTIDFAKPLDIDIPAWSLSALLNLMPETIVPDNGSHQVYQMDVYNYDGLRICEYVGEIDRDSLVGFEKEWFIDAA